MNIEITGVSLPIAATQYTLVTLGSYTAHELGHKWCYNAWYPGLVTKMKVNFSGGQVTLNSRIYDLYVKALTCSSTRWRLLGGIAAGPAAGCAFNLAVLYGTKQLEQKVDQNSSITENIFFWTKFSAHINLYVNIVNFICVKPTSDGNKFLSLFFTRHPALLDQLINRELPNYPHFMTLAKENSVDKIHWRCFLNYCHEEPLDEVAPKLKKECSVISLVKEETKHIFAKSQTMDRILKTANTPLTLICGAAYLTVLSLLYKDKN